MRFTLVRLGHSAVSPTVFLAAAFGLTSVSFGQSPREAYVAETKGRQVDFLGSAIEWSAKISWASGEAPVQGVMVQVINASDDQVVYELPNTRVVEVAAGATEHVYTSSTPVSPGVYKIRVKWYSDGPLPVKTNTIATIAITGATPGGDAE